MPETAKSTDMNLIIAVDAAIEMKIELDALTMGSNLG